MEASEWLRQTLMLRWEAANRDVRQSAEKGQATGQTGHEEALDENGYVHSRQPDVWNEANWSHRDQVFGIQEAKHDPHQQDNQLKEAGPAARERVASDANQRDKS